MFRRNGVLLVTFTLMAALLAVVAPSVSPAGAAGPATCTYTDTGTGYDVTWELEPTATKHVVYRTVDGSSLYWRGAVDAPGTTFNGDAYPTNGGTVVYTITAKDGNTVLGSTQCTEVLPESFACTVADNGTGYDISWSTAVGADRYVIQRQIDGSGTWYWRGAVNAPGSSFDGDPEPTQTHSTVDYQVVAKNGNTVLDAIDCQAGPVLACYFTEYSDGSFYVVLDDEMDPALVYEVRRSDNGGAPVLSGTLDPLDGGAFIDATAGTNVVFSVAVLEGAVETSVSPCEDSPYTPSQDLDVYHPPRLPDGTPGGQGSSSPLAAVATLDPPTAGSTAQQAVSACAASMYHDVPPAGWVWSRIFIPSGGTLRLDLLNRKNGVHNGSWGIEINAFEINADGTSGSKLEPGLHESTPPYWSTSSHDHLDRVIYSNVGTGRTFLLGMRIYALGSVETDEGAYSLATNFRIETNDGGYLPCAGDEVAACEDAGGTHYFPAEQTIGNTTYDSGCYQYQGCTSDLPLVAGIAEWACENDEIVDGLYLGAYAAVLVGSVLVVGPGPVVAGVVSGIAIHYGGPFVGAYAVALDMEKVLLVEDAPAPQAGTYPLWIVTLIALATDGALDAVEDLMGSDPLQIYEVDNEIDITGETLVKRIVAQGGFGAYAASQTPQVAEQLEIEINVRSTVRQCMEQVSLMNAADIGTLIYQAMNAYKNGFTYLAGEGGWLSVTEGGQSTTRHICEFVPIYAPFAGTHANGAHIAEQTTHVSQVLFGTTGVTPQGYTGPNPQIPKPEWIYLNRTIHGKKNDEWYRKPPYLCRVERSSGQACDEFPFNATYQGGAPTPFGNTAAAPHLSFINGLHNSAAGSDLRSFYYRCGVPPAAAIASSGGPFIVLPIDTSKIGTLSPGPAPVALRSLFLCPA